MEGIFWSENQVLKMIDESVAVTTGRSTIVCDVAIASGCPSAFVYLTVPAVPPHTHKTNTHAQIHPLTIKLRNNYPLREIHDPIRQSCLRLAHFSDGLFEHKR